MKGPQWFVALGLIVTLSVNSNAERVRGIDFDDSNNELIGWLSYGSETPLLNLPVKLPSGVVPFDYPARMETRQDGDGVHRVILTFAADSKIVNRNLQLVGWDKDNKVIPGIASKVQTVPGKNVALVHAELIRTKGFSDLRRLVLMSAKQNRPEQGK